MGPDDAVDVDGVAGVFGVPGGQVLGVAGEEAVHLVGVVDEVFHGGAATGGGFELFVVEWVAIAVVEAVFADAGEGFVLVVPGAVLAEFDEFGAASGFERFGGELGGFGFGSLCVVGQVVEAALEEFFGGGKAMAGFEVGELALHGVDEEADGDAAIVGFLTDDLGELVADGVGGVLGFGFV